MSDYILIWLKPRYFKLNMLLICSTTQCTQSIIYNFELRPGLDFINVLRTAFTP